MEIVLLTALGVGGATVLGAVLGLIFRRTSRRFNDGAMSFAGGVMLAAAILGLILPALEYDGGGVGICILGIFVGAFCLDFLDALVVRCYPKIDGGGERIDERMRRVILFVSAIAIHNLPEGIAAGVGFGTSEIGNAIMIATAIALQNVPEGLTVIVAMLGVGIKPWRTFLIASLTGVVEIVGTFIGYFAAHLSRAVLPFVLAFAGGTMLYVISEEMIPETHSEGSGKISTYFLLIGFCFMLIMDQLL